MLKLTFVVMVLGGRAFGGGIFPATCELQVSWQVAPSLLLIRKLSSGTKVAALPECSASEERERKAVIHVQRDSHLPLFTPSKQSIIHRNVREMAGKALRRELGW